MVRNRRVSAFIVTIRRDPPAAPEGYYVLGTDVHQATRRAARLVKANLRQVLAVVPG